MESGVYFVQLVWKRGDNLRAATNGERRLIERIRYTWTCHRNWHVRMVYDTIIPTCTRCCMCVYTQLKVTYHVREGTFVCVSGETLRWDRKWVGHCLLSKQATENFLCRYECKGTDVPFWNLLPFNFEKFRVLQEKIVSYCLTRQWGRTAFMRVSVLRDTSWPSTYPIACHSVYKPNNRRISRRTGWFLLCSMASWGWQWSVLIIASTIVLKCKGKSLWKLETFVSAKRCIYAWQCTTQ